MASNASLPMPFVVLASGAGSNARVLLEHAQAHPDRFQPQALISDRAGAGALEVAKGLGVPTFIVNPREEGMLLALLRKFQPRWALLAGYKRLVGKGFLDFFAGEGFHRVLNVHPSLLPAYPGLGGYERAFADGVKVSGVTVHLVDSGLDTGLCVLQETFQRDEGDDAASFRAKGQRIEHRIFVEALELAAADRIRLSGEKGARWVSTRERA